MLRFRAVVLLLASAGSADAQPAAPAADVPSEQVLLSYRSVPGCPSEAQFVEQVLARVRRVVRFGVAGASVRMSVTLDHAAEQAAGRLEVQNLSGTPTRREFTATSCDEVGSALALVAALALDPNARTEPLPVRSASTESPRTEPSSAPPPAPAAPPPVASTAAPPAGEAAPPRATRYVAWLGPAAELGLGQAPRALGLFGLSLGVRALTPRRFSPSVQLTPLWGKTGVTGPDAVEGEFAWALGRLEACPVSFTLAEHARLDPCAALEVGRLSARGVEGEIAVPVSVERWWVAPGATLSLHLGFRRWFLRLGAGALFPATRDEFVFHQPNRTVHQASPIVGGASLGVGFQFGE